MSGSCRRRRGGRRGQGSQWEGGAQGKGARRVGIRAGGKASGGEETEEQERKHKSNAGAPIRLILAGEETNEMMRNELILAAA